MLTWKLVIQDEWAAIDGEMPIVGNMELYIRADSIEEAIKHCYDWYTLGKIFIIKAELVWQYGGVVTRRIANP